MARADGRSILDEAAELYAAGRLDEAAAACRRALDEDPGLVAARATLAMVEEDRGNYAAALAECEAVLRLAPERLPERERADQLRSRLATESGAVFEDGGSSTKRRWLPLAIAGAVCLLVLIIGAIATSGHRGAAQQNSLGQGPLQALDQPPGGYGQPTPNGPNMAEVGPGEGPLAGRPIGEFPQDQSDQQRAAGGQATTAGSGPPDIPRADVAVEPPPALRSNSGTSPLQPVGPSPVRPGPLPAPGTPTRTDNGAPSQTMRPAGRVRISVADQPGNYGPAPGYAPAPGPGPAGKPGGYVGGPRQAGSSASTGGSALVGGPRGGGAYSGNFPRATVAGPGSTPARASRAMSGGWVGGGNAGGPRSVTAGGGAGASMTPGGPSAASAGGGGTYRVAAGSRASERPTVRAGQSASGGGARGGSNADDLRAQARNAAASGRKDDARNLYRRAIDGYRAEAGASPGRAGASRSAIDSCQRALEAMDAGQ
jgi:hypothetical protein